MTNIQTAIDPAESDALLQKVREQKALETFNPNDSELLKKMVECMGDSRGMMRLNFAETLGSIGKPATPFLVEALANHPNPVVRRASAKTLTLIGDPAALESLLEAFLHDEDTVVHGSAAAALAQLGEPSVPHLLEVLASPKHSENTKGHAAWALAFIGSKAKDCLYREIASDSVEVRAAVVGAIAKIAREEPEDAAFELLVNALTDTAEIVRVEAASALGIAAYKPAIPNLIELLHHASWESRKAAVLALMKIGTSEDPPELSVVLEPLEAALVGESEAQVRSVIQLAISQIQKQSEADDWE
ncbi:HEAT repeat domain-containing protein [Tychonema sp. LEGE 07203]|uniref:HEAT repeat domain-containing protein n=1 Tax=Tychonema sp. LEGE 07203 TaxID=1828671 RepID=UPI001882CA45|nr:HEAT repeat domain-containing protein [Tychonema sp. LEGE 07203]MBE9093827.1 HEAT repeat domain-containing protein [Tychonema sp. LEGE 07203]